jgi:hypothetical protein
MLVPQTVPFGSLPDAVQTLMPELQSVVSFVQDPCGVQSVPEVQLTQAPALHTWLVPQLVPFDRLVVGAHVSPASPQTYDPF